MRPTIKRPELHPLFPVQRNGDLQAVCLRALFVALLALPFAGPSFASDVVRGGAVPLPSDEISPAERARIQAAIAANVDALQRSRRLPPGAVARSAAPAVSFQWPLQLVPGHPEGVARTVINFVDHDADYPGHVQDYMCGTRTYDQANGYNHQGTDITSYPFALRKMDNDEAIVVAAAPGTIVLKEDGQFDRSCAMNMNSWNAVYLRHDDGSMTWYGHLKAGSLTAKSVGDFVAAGEFLGVMGSSGDSTGPHLHFEVHDSTGKVIDPFAGPCNASTPVSWWADQRPYHEPAIDLVMTSDQPVEFTACPTPEVEHRSAYFQPGQTIYLNAFLTDQLLADTTTFSLYTPAGTQFTSIAIQSNADFSAGSYWEWEVALPPSAPFGTWRFEVGFKGQTQSVSFQVGATEPPRANAIEYYNASLNHYFMTAFPTEAAMLDAGSLVRGWSRTGESFPVYSQPGSGLAAVCRFFGTPGRGVNSHFYTAFDRECAIVEQNPNWTFEADAFYIATPTAVQQCPPSTRPVFRLYNNGQGGEPNHRYTTSWPVISDMQSENWLLEGLVACAPL